ncbi:hypothetical protein RS030_71007 [Cryptosporidium xiaoi]|uniref:Uncharacterized protein n=1 Tax=Cryptosporidium xiaoi TaxID=659607 RepID=A0AAV9XT61_9CRYT
MVKKKKTNIDHLNKSVETIGESRIEINEIFVSKSRKLKAEAPYRSRQKQKSVRKNKLDMRKIGKEYEIPLSKTRPLRYTNDGLPIYNIEDLNIVFNVKIFNHIFLRLFAVK